MNPLFSKIKNKKIYAFWILIAIQSVVLANDPLKNHEYSQYYKNSDAYILYQYTDVTFQNILSIYMRHVSYQKKMVINSRKGVREFAFLNLSKHIIDHLKEIQVKTLKADGSVIKLDSSIILNYNSQNEGMDLIEYPIPGIEPGDTVEVSYTYEENLHLHQLYDFVSLINSAPSLHSEYTIKAPAGFFIRYKTYNGFPDPQVFVNDTMVYCVFKMENIKRIKQNKYTCLQCELPYFYYTVNTKETDIVEWKDVYNTGFNLFTQPLMLDYEKKSYYNRWKRQVIGDANDSSKHFKFELLYNHILESFTIEPTKQNEIAKSSGYFLKEQRLDPISLRRLYRQVLEDLEINYWAVFARSKRAGNIDPNYIRNGEYDHIFFAYENGLGSLNLLYPHDLNYKYQINEIPTSLFNTTAIIVQPHSEGKVKQKDKFINMDLEMAVADSVIIKTITLSGKNSHSNYLKQYFSCDVNVENNSNSLSSKLMVSGGLSTDLRSFLSLLKQNDEINDFYYALSEFEGDNTAFKIDTIYDMTFNKTTPFIYTLKGKGSIKNAITFVNDSLISITLDKLIQHTLIHSDSDTINLNYYLDYSYSDFLMVMFNFSSNIEVLKNDDYNQVLKNDIGELTFQVNVPTNNTLTIVSDYRIKKDLIERSEYEQLKELNNLLKKIKKMRLLLKVF